MLINATPFKRGANFTFLLQLPASIEAGHFTGWTPRCQIRKQENDTPAGFIAEVQCTWEDPEVAKVLRIHHEDTSNWPIGLLETDIMFISPDGVKVMSETVLFDVQRDITK